VAHKSPASADLSVEEDGAVLHHMEYHQSATHVISQELRELLLIFVYGEHLKESASTKMEGLALRFAVSARFMFLFLNRGNSFPTSQPSD
jgi:DNA/RNA-binding domain of Phe-tRNA-synthetase-like protein